MGPPILHSFALSQLTAKETHPKADTVDWLLVCCGTSPAWISYGSGFTTGGTPHLDHAVFTRPADRAIPGWQLSCECIAQADVAFLEQAPYLPMPR